MRQWMRSSEIVWEMVDGEAVLVSPAARFTCVLNPAASFIWRCCDGTASLEQLAQRLAAACGREIRKARADVQNFCRELEAQGLLTAQDAGQNEFNTEAQRSTGKGSRGTEMGASLARECLPPMIKLRTTGLGFRGRPSPRGNTRP